MFSRGVRQVVSRSVGAGGRTWTRCMSSGQHLPVTDLTEDEAIIRDAASRFAREVVGPKVSEMDRDAKLDENLIRGLFENGFMGVEIEAEHGGSESSFTSACLVIEELAKVDPSVSVCCDVQNTLVNNVFRKWGSKELQAKYLPRLATDTVGSFCLSEPGSGSDAFALKTKAEKDGDDYILNGQKMWITNGGEAGIYLVMANVDFSKGYKGITCFVVEREWEGVSIGKKEDKLGIRASSTVPVMLDNVRVPKENIMGNVGEGYKYAIGILNEGRVGIAAQAIGLAQGVFEATMPYLFERQQFGQYIGDFQAMQIETAEIATAIRAARLMVFDAARRKETGQDFVKEAAMAKSFAADIAERTTDKCLHWMGGVGFTKEYPQEKFLRDARILNIYEGTRNVNLLTVAKHLKNQFK